MIKGKNTKPEIIVRKYLFHCGFRFRVNVKRLPGTPDIVLRKYKTAIFVNGCFWPVSYTHLHGKGMYEGHETEIIFTIAERKDMPRLKDEVKEIDPNAFVSTMHASKDSPRPGI